MKTILAIGIISLCAQHILAAFIANCTNSEDRIKELKNMFYSSRKGAAEEFQIANMYDMNHDPKLEREAKQMKSCEDYKAENNFRIVSWMGIDSFNAFRKFVKKTSKKNVFERTSLYNSEWMHPLQTTFIECYLTSPCNKTVPVELYNYTKLRYYSDERIVLFGPKSTISESDFIFGPPGSHCPNGNTTGGLCKVAVEENNIDRKNSANQGVVLINSILMYFSIALMIFLV